MGRSECVADFRELSQEGKFSKRKALIRNFVEHIDVLGTEATLTSAVPMLSDGVTSESASVLDSVKSGPTRGTRTIQCLTRKQATAKLPVSE